MPGLGRKSASGSSALIRTSIAWPAKVTSACFSRSGRPSAMASCSATMSMPVTASVTGCSTWIAGVDLKEVELATACAGGVGVDEELDRARAPVAEPLAERDRRRAQPFPQAVVEGRGGCLLDELLVAPLHRAVPVAQVDDVLAVAEELHLDVPPALDVPLQVHPGIAERGARLRAGDRDGVLKLRGIAHDPQPAPAAAPGRLDEHRVPDPARDLRPLSPAPASRDVPGVQSVVRKFRDVAAGEHREAGGDRVLAGGQLVPGGLERLRGPAR